MDRFIYDYIIEHYDANEPDYIVENIDLAEVLSLVKYRSRYWARSHKDADGNLIQEKPPTPGKEVIKKYKLVLVDEDMEIPR